MTWNVTTTKAKENNTLVWCGDDSFQRNDILLRMKETIWPLTIEELKL